MIKHYLLRTYTIKDYIEACKEAKDTRVDTHIFSYTAKPKTYTPEQQEIQNNNDWVTHQSGWVRVREEDVEETLIALINKTTLSKYREDLAKKVYDDFMNTELYITLELDDDPERSYGPWGTQTFINGRPANPDIDTDDTTLTTVLEHGTTRKYRRGEYETVHVESFTAKLDYYSGRALENIEKLINKLIKAKLPYCIKLGKSIIPDEYLDKGEQGIDEYITLKRSSNKNNSMEKQLLRQTLNEKKNRAIDIDYELFRVITHSQPNNYSVPRLEIDGRWNKGRIRKHMAQMLGKDDKAIYQLTDDQIVNKVKETWKKILMDAYNAVDNYSPNTTTNN